MNLPRVLNRKGQPFEGLAFLLKLRCKSDSICYAAICSTTEAESRSLIP
jgi:hypothetical protein